ncbi:hypothetical protein HK103_003751 [Boothiomyces macroporosus]|uniref:Cell division control protein 24 OB domain-containing protein n=1 Tax=Boothiomyces macroporosus TaxID=261099 RepID=A0AAD5UKD6_9FUNG|nr:hypothetical protein HK103_003751 [Boothiomyces macroporosus]
MEILDFADSLQQSFGLPWNFIATTLFKLMMDYPGGITRTIIESSLEQNKPKKHKLSDLLQYGVYYCKYDSGYLMDTCSKIEHFLHSKYLAFIDQGYPLRITNVITVSQLEDDEFIKYILPTESVVFEIPSKCKIVEETKDFLEDSRQNMKLYLKVIKANPD